MFAIRQCARINKRRSDLKDVTESAGLRSSGREGFRTSRGLFPKDRIKHDL